MSRLLSQAGGSRVPHLYSLNISDLGTLIEPRATARFIDETVIAHRTRQLVDRVMAPEPGTLR